MQPIIELRDVNLRYGNRSILESINIHLHAGQFAALVGPSGAGKTSLLRLILGTLRPNSGSVLINGRDHANDAPTLAYVPQLETVDWNFPVTVEQVVQMGLIGRGSVMPWATKHEKQQVAAMLEQLGLADLAKNHIRNLSGGQQQRVFLARALIAQPEILVLDEPTTGVDLQVAETILHMLGELNQRGMTIVMTTHDLNAAAAHAPWIICLNRTVIAQGTPETVFTEAILHQTYHADMLVLHHEGMIIIQQRPHGHGYHEVVPNPILGHDES